MSSAGFVVRIGNYTAMLPEASFVATSGRMKMESIIKKGARKPIHSIVQMKKALAQRYTQLGKLGRRGKKQTVSYITTLDG